ncbi:MAG: LVIVD repeat-containing protein [Egibacteraceae bacterium]
MRLARSTVLMLGLILLLALPSAALADPEDNLPDVDPAPADSGERAVADHEERPDVRLRALGHAPNPASFLNPDIAPPEINSDLAFWGDLAYQGNYDGFRIIDISDRRDPVELSHERCGGNQGDVIVWDNVLVRTWNSPAPEGATCDGQPVPEGFEGLHVFDVSDKSDPELIGSLALPCGTHTATGVPDLANDRLIIYNSGTGGGPCYFFDVVELPLSDPAAISLLWQEPVRGQHGCHDVGVILGSVNLAACASGSAANVYDIGENDHPGGSLEDPEFLYTVEEEGVGEGGNWHSAAFTWDGEVLVLGWEPGGGGQPECEATDSEVKRTAFFYDVETGEKLGQWTLPRAQSSDENCTIHNYNVIPMRNGRYIMVSGNYQAGTWVTEFTDPSSPEVLGWSDPLPLEPLDIGGAWSSYWYNRTIFESDITEGLNVFRLLRRNVRRQSLTLDHLNPQTQEFSLP